jgi:hypothetical protein
VTCVGTKTSGPIEPAVDQLAAGYSKSIDDMPAELGL